MTDVLTAAVVLLVAGLVVWGLWRAAKPRCVVLIAIEAGRPHLVRGKAVAGFLQAAQAICAENQLTDGVIRGFWRGRRIALTFSPSIPPAAQQQFRNVWLAHE